MEQIYEESRTINRTCRAILRNEELLAKFKCYAFARMYTQTADEEGAMEGMFDLVNFMDILSKISTKNLDQECLRQKSLIIITPINELHVHDGLEVRGCHFINNIELPNTILGIASFKLVCNGDIGYPIAMCEALNALLTNIRKIPEWEPEGIDENVVYAKCKADFKKYYMKNGKTIIRAMKPPGYKHPSLTTILRGLLFSGK